MPRSPVTAFWEKVERKTNDECWLWTGAVSSHGYGTVGWDGAMCLAHRVAAFLSGKLATPFWVPSRTDKTLVLHHCDNPLCCNPAHLFTGNFADNSHDCLTKHRHRTACGERHHSAKLNPQLVKEIRDQFAYEYASLADLARKHGVSNTAIAKVVYGESYKQVSGPTSSRSMKKAA